MSTDLRLTKRRNGENFYEIWTTKQVDALRDWRTLEKLYIDEVYWKSEPRHTWCLKTEADLPPTFLANLKYLRPMLRPGALLGISEIDAHQAAQLMKQALIDRCEAIAPVATWCDSHLHLQPGDSMLVARFLLAHRIWRCDLTKPITMVEPMGLSFT